MSAHRKRSRATGRPHDFSRRLKEIEELLQFPGVRGHVARAAELAISIAREAPPGRAGNLAMQVISEAQALRQAALPLRPDRTKLNTALWRLRLALEELYSTSSESR